MDLLDDHIAGVSTQDHIEFVILQKQEGKSFKEIRETLSSKGLSKAEVDEIISEADQLLLDGMIVSSQKSSGIWVRIVAYVLILGGIGVSLLATFKLTLQGGGYLIWGSPIVAGLGLLFYDNKRRLNERRAERRRSPYNRNHDL